MPFTGSPKLATPPLYLRPPKRPGGNTASYLGVMAVSSDFPIFDELFPPVRCITGFTKSPNAQADPQEEDHAPLGSRPEGWGAGPGPQGRGQAEGSRQKAGAASRS